MTKLLWQAAFDDSMISQQTRMDWSELKWIQIFRKYWFTNVKINEFSILYFYSFIRIAWSISLPFNLKIILAFSMCATQYTNKKTQNNCEYCSIQNFE